MLNKSMLLPGAAIALAVLAFPGIASAQWTKNHQSIAQNESSELTGQAKFQAELGHVECQTVSGGQLTAGTTTGHMQLAVDLQGEETVTDNCSIGGALASIGCTDVKAVAHEGLPWTVHATSTQTISITMGTTIVQMHGGIFCPKTIDFTPGTLHTTTSTANTWTTGQLSGQLQAMTSTGVNQNATITGHGFITPGGTSGVA